MLKKALGLLVLPTFAFFHGHPEISILPIYQFHEIKVAGRYVLFMLAEAVHHKNHLSATQINIADLMASEEEVKELAGAVDKVIRLEGDKYRSILQEEAENTKWRHGAPPIFDKVNKLFEEGRTKEWPKGSLEEAVQNAVKSWEMELSHKTRLQDFKTINPEKFKLIVNGREGLSAEEALLSGSYNALLKNSLPKEFQYYKLEEETFESSHDAFHSAFPRGFAWEVISVYSGPPVVAYKFRHWGYFEGPFKGHAPTSEMIEFYGIGVMKVDESMRAEEVEIYYDPSMLFEGLLKGKSIFNSSIVENSADASIYFKACPFSKKE